MRVAGWILLIAGAVLCATLVWATLGFLLMGVGLLSLLVAENNRKRSRRADLDDVDDAGVDGPMMAPAPVAAPPPTPEPELLVRREPSMGTRPPASSYDRQAWQQLVESDADLAAVASVLGDYGHQYVDELASEYLAVADKARLPAIVDGIIGRAGARVAPRVNPGPASDVKPVSSVRTPNLMAPRPDRQPRPLPPAKPEVSEISPDPAPQPVAPVRQEMAGAPASPPMAVEPVLDTADRNKTIVSADDDLTAMLGRLAGDAATPGKS